MHSPTQSEFDNLPATVQRKCFSTLERLRYAEAQAQAQIKATTTATHVPIASHFNPWKLLSNGQTSLAKIKNSVQPKFLQRSPSNRHASNSLTCANVTQEDALWFSRLPEKIQRGQFSIEEQILLTGRKEDVILDAADEKFYKLGEKIGNRSVPSLQSFYTGPSSPDSFDTAEYSSVFSEDPVMESEELLNSFQWLETDPDLSLDDYHAHLAETVEKDPKAPGHNPILRKQQSFSAVPSSNERRSSSFVSRKSIEQWGSNWPLTSAPPVHSVAFPVQVTRQHMSSDSTPRPSARDHHSTSTADKWGSVHSPTSNPPRPSLDGTVSGVDSNATHYLNPEARLKLRLYLASPSKFDEALEFGFPLLNSQPSVRPSTSSRRPSASTAHSVRQCKPMIFKDFSGSPTFLDDSTTTTASVDPSNAGFGLLSASETSRCSTPLARDEVSSLETPVSPSIDSFQPSSLSASQSQDQPGLQAQFRQIEREPYLRALPGREMTLRMTLTRPDLRADDSVLYPPPPPEPTPRFNVLKRSLSVNKLRSSERTDNDLLKLEDLQFGDDAATVRMEKENQNGLRRFLSRK